MAKLLEKFLQYGVTSTLAAKAIENELSVSKVRTLSLSDLESRFGMSHEEGRFLKKAVVRQPLLIAQPKVSVDKTPAIAYSRRYLKDLAADEEDFLGDLDP